MRWSVISPVTQFLLREFDQLFLSSIVRRGAVHSEVDLGDQCRNGSARQG